MKNRLLQKLLLILSFVVSTTLANGSNPFASGTGTVGDPYVITIAAHLNNVRNHLSSHFVLGDDIDLSGYPNWVPIGNSTTKFTGSFDGQNFTISNLTILQETYSSDIGLFGYFQPSTVGDYIKNVTLNNVSINTVGQSIGAVVGYCYYATIHNCSMNGDISGLNSIGGIVGRAIYSVTISNCYADVTINAENGNNGGIVGTMWYANCSISKCFAKGTINGSDQYNGGIVGSFGMDSFGTIENCYSAVDVIGEIYSNYSGGIAGGISNGNKTIKNCFSTGLVQSGSLAGGISGNVNNATVKNCFSANTRVNVLLSNQWAYAGRIGADNFTSTYTNNYAWEDIYVNNEKITDGTLTNINGANITLSQIQSEAFFTNIGNWVDEAWDFGSTWAINLSISPYPILNNIPTAFQTIKHSQGIFWAVPFAYGINQTIENPALGGLNAITYESSNPSVIEVVGSSLITHSAGTADITATVAESEFYAANSITQTFTVYQNGTGTKDDPFLISTVEQLNSIRNNLTMHFRLANNLDLGVAPWNEGEGWQPIAQYDPYNFSGSFDGAGFTISNLTINRPDESMVGLFGKYCPATPGDSIKNLTLQNVIIVGNASTGAIAGEANQAHIYNCHSSGSVSGPYMVGGLVGTFDYYGWGKSGTPVNFGISHSSSSCSVTNNNTNDYTGGIVGYIEGEYDTKKDDKDAPKTRGEKAEPYENAILANCVFTGTVNGNEYSGGIAGYAAYTTISDCQSNITLASTGIVTGTNNVGGIAGSAGNSTITGCSSSAEITGNSYIGGIVGNFYAGTNLEVFTISNCNFSGSVSGVSIIGGIAGSTGVSMKSVAVFEITNCHNTGVVNASGEYVGGIAGKIEDSTTISNCSNSGSTSNESSNYLGGIAGGAFDSEIFDSENSGTVSGNNHIGGVVGYSYDSHLEDCQSSGFVSGNSNIGGIVGSMNTTMKSSFPHSVINCHSTANVKGTGEKVGGIVGYGGDLLISKCSSKGNISGSSRVGGIVGQINFYGEITQSFSSGLIKGYKSGGIAGEINGNSINSTLIKNNYSTAKIEGDGNYSGGIIGSGYYLTIANCYSSGEIDRGYGIIGAIDEKNPYNGLITNTISINAKISGGNRISSEHRNLNNNYAWDDMYVNDQKILDGTINNKNGLNVSLSDLSEEFFTNSENWDTEAWDFTNTWVLNPEISPYPILQVIDTETQQVQHTQSITWTQELPNTLIPEPLELTADGGVNRPITYTSSNPAVASIDGNTMTVHAAGSAEITATIAGSEFYAPASMTRELIVYEGDGTPENPYLISNLQQLNGVRNNLSAHYKLIADIDLSSIENWEPIGSMDDLFTGSFDGNGFTLSNLTVNKPNDEYVGLFSSCTSAETEISIKNLNVVNANIICMGYGGVIVGFIEYSGNIQNCHTSGAVKGGIGLGGIVGAIGQLGVSITNCSSSCIISSTDSRAGGIVGEFYGSTSIENCSFNGEVKAAYDEVGGIVGWMYQGFILYCHSTGNVSGINKVGGIVGFADNNSIVTECFSHANVFGSSNVGGIAGTLWDNSAITNTYSTGNINALNSGNRCGGIVGYAYNSTVQQNYSTGKITGDTETGGITGYTSGALVKYNAAINAKVGEQGFLGRINGRDFSSSTLSYNYAWDEMYVAEALIPDGTLFNLNGLNASFENLSTESFYTTTGNWDSNPWNFTETWVMNSEVSPYPILQAIATEPQQVKHAQAITWPQDIATPIGNSFTLTAVGGRTGSTIVYSSSQPDVASIVGDEMTVNTTGGSHIMAYVEGNDFFAADSVKKVLINFENNGTELDPYLIYNLAELDAVRLDLNAHYKLMADIDMSPIANWEPIGNSSTYFGGSFDGNNFELTNLNINKPFSSYVGLFGYIEVATIKNLAVNNVNIIGYESVGAIAGIAYDNSLIENCGSSGYITDVYEYAGGIAGAIYDSEVTNSWFTGSINNTNNSAGGIVGYSQYSIISGCFNSGNISGDYSIGGIAGQDFEAEFTNCYNTGSITGVTYNIGGISGEGKSTINYCFNSGVIKSISANTVGGIYGHLYQATMKNSISLTAKLISNGEYTNRLNGRDNLTSYINNYAWTDMYVNSSKVTTGTLTNANGQNATLGQLKSEAFYTTEANWDGGAWDFGIWEMNPAVSPYPILKNIPEEVQKVQHTQVMTNAWTQTLPQDATVGDEIELTAPSEGPSEEIEYISSNPAVAEIDGNQLTAVGLGTATITVQYPATEFYGQSNGFSKTFTVTNKANQTLTWSQSLAAVYGDADIALNATASSGLTVTYASSNPSVATVTGNTLTIVGVGSSIITASQVGNDNYNAATNLGATLTVTAKSLTIGGTFTVADRVYDGTAAATAATNAITINGVISPDVVTFTPAFAFADMSVGAAKTVSLTNATTLGGVDAAKYMLSLTGAPTATASITAKELTIGGNFTVADREYDGTTAATAATNALTLTGKITDDVVTLTPVLAFADKNVGTAKVVSLGATSALAGADAGNYTLSLTGAPTATANITAKALTVTGAAATAKVYDGTTAATISGATLNGAITPDVVTLANHTAGTFASKNVGTDVAVTTAMTITGADAGNYTVAQPTGLKANITAKGLTIGGTFTAEDKEYDGTTAATIDASGLTLITPITGDAVTLTGVVAQFASAEVGEGKVVSITAAGLDGADKDNYSLSLTGAPTATASITAPAATYTLTLEVDPEEAGTVTGAGEYEEDAEVELTAAPADGYVFVSWKQGETVISTAAAFTYTMPAEDVTLTAYFEEAPELYTVTFTVTGNGAPVDEAIIAIEGVSDELITNTEGTATIELEDGEYAYTVTKEGFVAETGTFTLAGEAVSVNVTLTLVGVETGMLSSIAVYPNPFRGSITLNNVGRANRVVISNLIGQRVMDIQLSGAETETIITEGLSNGIYLIQLYSEKGEMVVKKMVKE